MEDKWSVQPYTIEHIVKNRRLGRIKGRLTRNQRIAYNIFLQTAYNVLQLDGYNHTMFRISLRDFLKLAGFNYNNYYSHLFKDTTKQKSLKTFLRELQTVTLELEWRNEKNEPYKVLSTSLLSQFVMDKDKDYIEFAFPPFIRESILAHQNFYILYLPVIISMKSTYSIALYEQILQRRNFKVWYVTLQDLKALMGVANKYKRELNFDACVIRPAVKEINKIIKDIKLTYEKVKTGSRQKVVAYKFSWRFNDKWHYDGDHLTRK